MIPLILAGMAAAAAAKGVQNYAQKNKEKKEAKKQAVKNLWAQHAGPYASMMGVDLPEGGNAFQDIAMPTGQAIIGGLGSEDEDDKEMTFGRGASQFARGFGGG